MAPASIAYTRPAPARAKASRIPSPRGPQSTVSSCRITRTTLSAPICARRFRARRSTVVAVRPIRSSPHLDEPAVLELTQELADVRVELNGRIGDAKAQLRDELVERAAVGDEVPDQQPDRIDAVVGARLEVQEHSSALRQLPVDGALRLPDLRIAVDHRSHPQSVESQRPTTALTAEGEPQGSYPDQQRQRGHRQEQPDRRPDGPPAISGQQRRPCPLHRDRDRVQRRHRSSPFRKDIDWEVGVGSDHEDRDDEAQGSRTTPEGQDRRRGDHPQSPHDRDEHQEDHHHWDQAAGLEPRPEQDGDCHQEQDRAERHVGKVVHHRSELDRERRRRGDQERLEGPHELLLSDGVHDPAQSDLEERGDRDPGDHELDVGGGGPPERREETGIHQPPHEREDHDLGDEVRPVDEERQTVAPHDQEVAPEERRQLPKLLEERSRMTNDVGPGRHPPASVRRRKARSMGESSSRQVRTWMPRSSSLARARPRATPSVSESTTCPSSASPDASSVASPPSASRADPITTAGLPLPFPSRSSNDRGAVHPISLVTLPENRTIPWSISVTRLANPRISSTRCVAHRMAVPPRARSPARALISNAPWGSKSCVASSTKSTGGSTSSAPANDRRFCIPWEDVPTEVPPTSPRPTAFRHSPPPRAAARRPRPCMRAKKMRFSSPEIRR